MGFDWFRVDAAMVDHPKVLSLAAEMGDPRAGWYVIRLWAWLTRYAPRGRMPQALARAAEVAAGWCGEPGQLLSMMHRVGLLDSHDSGEVEVHDWWEKQGPLVEKANKDAARKRKKRRADGARTSGGPSADIPRTGARTARVEDGRDGRDGEDVTEKREALSTEVDQTLPDLQKLWNEIAHPSLPRWREATVKRKAASKARARDRSETEWRAVIAKVNASAFCRGENGRGWKADLDWLLRPDTAAKVLEGKYDAKTSTPAVIPAEHRQPRLLYSPLMEKAAK